MGAQDSMHCNRDDGLRRVLSLEQGRMGHKLLAELAVLELQKGAQFRQEFLTKYLCYNKVRWINEGGKATNLPMPIVSLTSTLHLISKRDSLCRGPVPPSASSPSKVPPLTPLALFGTSNTRLATPSAPGGIMYSGPRNGTVVSVSEICTGVERCWPTPEPSK